MRVTLSRDWRSVLFPDLEEEAFADAYAQTVTFALLTASSLGVAMTLDTKLQDKQFDQLDLTLYHIAGRLKNRRGLLGSALMMLTTAPKVRQRLAPYLESLLAVISSVDWGAIRTGRSDTHWLHFYEDFLEVYDPAMRKKSGSYYPTTRRLKSWIG